MKRTIRSLVVFMLMLAASVFSQNVTAPYSASYWSAYADKLQLTGSDRQEFLSSHKRMQTPVPVATTPTVSSSFSSPFNSKGPNNNNQTMAPPCFNPDFELGTIAGWTVSSGFHPGYNAMGCCPNAGAQHSIMPTAAGLDPYGGFPVVFPGGNFSLRIGNNAINGEADRIEQQFLVTPANANFSYKYAVVLQDPNHPISQQPSFQVEMVDTLNQQIPCTYFYVAAGQNIPGFFNSTTPGVIYKPWTTVLIDLTPYIGQNVTIRFSTYDCSLGGHFGYAYIDGVCQPFLGGGTATVCAGSTHTFCAPNGLASYMWNGPSVNNFIGQCCPVTAPGVYTVSTTLFSNCNGPPFMYTLTTQPSPTAVAGPNQTVCANNNLVTLVGGVTGFSAIPQWLSSGTGTFSSPSSIATTYTPSLAEIASGSSTITLTTINNGVCPPSTSTLQVTILPSPTVNAGPDATICATASAPLNGIVTGATNTGSWSSTGTGNFSPSNAVLNATYTPSAADISSGSVTLALTSTNNQGCFSATDLKVIFFQTPPLANAGINPTVCANNSTVVLSGAILNFPATPVWTSSGTGAFTSSTSLNTNYIPSAFDISAGSVVLTLSTANNGVCPAATSTVQLSITPAPVVSAGANQTVCSTSAISLNGNVSGPTTTGFWSTNGTGTFTPTPNSPVTAYNPSAADIAIGTLTFVLSSTGNGNCIAVSSTITVAISQIATVSAGPNQALCSTTSTLALSGNVSGVTTTGFWSSNGSGGYNPGQGFLNTTYFLSAADIASGSVIFTLTSTNNGVCPGVTDTVMMSIKPISQVNAGPNQLVCENQGTIGLTGSINTPNGAWTTGGGGGFSPSNLSFTTAYAITPADAIAGFVTFTLTSTLNGPCPTVQDSVRINIRRLATVDAGANQAICSNNSTVALSGSVSVGGNSGFWTSNGTGAHNPGAAFLNNVYFTTPNDIINGSIIFTLTSTNNGPCPGVIDTVMVKIVPLAQVGAGSGSLVCENQGSVTLNGNVTTGSGVWNSSGTGFYTPSNNALNANYFFGSSDVVAGFVTFTLSSSNNAPCATVRDSMRVNIRRMAIVDAGVPSLSLCSTTTVVTLSGSVSVGSTQGLWTSLGTGNFLPNPTNLNPSYIYSGADLTAGSVKLALTSLNNGVCPPASDTVLVLLNKDPLIDLNSDTTVCSYQNPISILANLSGNFGGLFWTSTGNGTFVPGPGANPIKYKFGTNELNSGQVALNIALSNNGPCANKSGSINIIIRPTPVAAFAASSYTIFNPSDPIAFTNNSQQANAYNWSFGDGDQSTQTHPSHTYPSAGFFDVRMIATNQYNCSDTADARIVVKSDIKFPNAFTPNTGGSNGGGYTPGDFSNDVFFPYTSGVTEYNLRIFNRYGELIFQSNDVKIGWDGYFNGKLCQQDAYVWKADVKFFDDTKFSKTGSVTLLR